MGLGLFLFGLLYTHAVSPDATVSHLASEKGVSASGVHSGSAVELVDVASATSAQPTGEQPEGHHDGHGQQHADADCVMGQPPQGPDVAVPCLSPLSSENGDEGPGSAPARHAAAAARDFAAPRTQAADSTVLRI
ncbi:hypothetical protein GCM10010307_18990 [Streptomyces vastus]|uniref:Secreted protein n=1 Tax=Streptomyces vastus TaxID=285451 RepID=A0ABN3QKK0_9ACTN